MSPVDSLFNTYIDINILLLVAAVLWMLTRSALGIFGLGQAFRVQLRLFKGMFIAVALSPLVVAAFGAIQSAGLLGQNNSLNLTDMIVAQYLNGAIQMPAADFQQVVGLRDTLTRDLTGLKSTFGIAAVALLLGGFAFLSVRTLASALRLRAMLRRAYPWRRFGNIHLLLSDATMIPFSTRSLRRRFIVLPTSMLTDSRDLRMALSHEFQHIRQADVEWEILMGLLRPLFFWNPAFALWRRRLERLRELACDEAVLARSGGGFDARAYGDCLLRVCRAAVGRDMHNQIEVPSVSFIQVGRLPFSANSVRFLRYRIASIMVQRRARLGRTGFALLMVPVIAAVLAGSLAIKRPGDWSQERLMLSTIVNLERLAARNAAMGSVSAFGR